MYYSSIFNYLKNLHMVPSGMTTNKCIHTCSSQGKKKWAYLKIDERWMLQLHCRSAGSKCPFPYSILGLHENPACTGIASQTQFRDNTVEEGSPI